MVDTLAAWKFEAVRSGPPERYWMTFSVHFEDGKTIGEVDVASSTLASALPKEPLEGLHVVEAPTMRTRVRPQMPSEALGRYGDHFVAECALLLALDERGKPTDVTVKECPEVFRDSATSAAWKWRFNPRTVDGTATTGEFLLQITYKLN